MVTGDFASWMQVGWHFDLACLPVIVAAFVVFVRMLR